MYWKSIFLLVAYCFSAQAQTGLKLQFTGDVKKSQGYYFLTVQKPVIVSTNTTEPYYNTILDKNGELVFYQRFAGNEKVCDFKLQPNGLLSYFNKDKFYLLDSTLSIIDSVFCKNGIQTDSHELLFLSNGGFVLLGVETITLDLKSYKMFNHFGSAGSPTATVICGVIQEQDKAKHVVFEWHSKDHFKFLDVDTFYLSDPTKVDWTHVNALALANDGNYLLSVRHFNEVTKISRKDSTILWRLGGYHNQFDFLNDRSQFIGQHNISQLFSGNLTLYDNGRKLDPPHPGTAKEYKLNEKNKTVKLVWKYTDRPEGTSYKGLGNVQRLANGNTLVNYGISYGSTKIFSVLNSLNMPVVELRSEDSLRSYRVYNYRALPFNLPRPTIKKFVKNNKTYLEADKKYQSYRWSTGSMTNSIEIQKAGKYILWVPAGKNGFIASEPLLVEEFLPETK